jgi:WD40 repeat protein
VLFCSGKSKWDAELSSSPLCMDITPDKAYIALGMRDGTVQFFSTKSGKRILQFKAHNAKVIFVVIFRL